jgi:hypothetical protein
MGGIKSDDLNSLSKDIWNWCCDKNIWLSADQLLSFDCVYYLTTILILISCY